MVRCNSLGTELACEGIRGEVTEEVFPFNQIWRICTQFRQCAHDGMCELQTGEKCTAVRVHVFPAADHANIADAVFAWTTGFVRGDDRHRMAFGELLREVERARFHPTTEFSLFRLRE